MFIQHRGRPRSGGAVAGGDPAAWDAAMLTWSHGENIGETLRSWPDWALIQRYIRPPARVLEAGCGFAKWVWFLQGEGYDAYGIDFSQAAISKSLERWPDLRLQRGLIQKMPYEDNFFDAVISFGAVEHDEAGPEGMLLEMRRVLAPGGILYCTVPCLSLPRRMGILRLREFIRCNPMVRRLRGLPPEVEFWQHFWTPGDYARILESAGFHVIAIEPLAPVMWWRGRRPGTWWRRIVDGLHKRWPWLTTHMNAGICSKPDPDAARNAAS